MSGQREGAQSCLFFKIGARFKYANVLEIAPANYDAPHHIGLLYCSHASEPVSIKCRERKETTPDTPSTELWALLYSPGRWNAILHSSYDSHLYFHKPRPYLIQKGPSFSPRLVLKSLKAFDHQQNCPDSPKDGTTDCELPIFVWTLPKIRGICCKRATCGTRLTE